MKNIEIDDELYLHIVGNTQSIGENASSILRRLLNLGEAADSKIALKMPIDKKAEIETAQTSLPKKIVDDVVMPNESDSVALNEVDHNSESVFNFINKEELAMQRGAVGRFLLILAALYRAHPKQFNVVSKIGPKVSARKTKRLYFALSEELLQASGSSTKPKQVPESPYWVITNSNTTRKKMMLTEAAALLGYNEADVIKIRELL